MPFLRRHWPWLILVLFPLLPLWRAVFLGEAIGPFDQIRQMAPWNGPAPDRPFDVLQADAVLQFYPWRDMVFEAWGKGQLPLWNPYQLAGTPLLANSQSAGFYPPHILMGVLHVPTPLAITLLAWFHLALAGLGVASLSRRLGASREGAAIGGLLFSGSAFMLAWTGLPSVISTCAWIPWVISAAYGLFERERIDDLRLTIDDSQAQSRYRMLRNAAMLSFSVGMMLLAGHLQFAFYGLMATGFVLLARLICELFHRALTPESEDRALDQSSIVNRRSSIRGFLMGAIALALGAGLAAPQLLPVLEYSKFSHRKNVPTEEGYKAYVAGAIAPFELVGLVYPTAVGLPFEFAPEAKPLSQYWPALVKQGANFAEGAIGIGPLALFGLLMFPWRRAPKRLWVPIAALGVVAFLLALGTILNKPLYFLIPGWSSTGSPGRIGVLFVLAATTLCALGFCRHDPTANRFRTFLSIFGVLIASTATVFWAATLSGQLQPRFGGMEQKVLRQIASIPFLPLVGVTLFLSGLFVFAFMRYRTPERFSANAPDQGYGVAFAHLFVLFWLLTVIVPTAQPFNTSTLQHFNTSRTSGRAAFINDPWELIVAAPATMPPNTASLLRIHELGGYDSLLHKDTHLFLGYVNGQDPAPPANGNIQFIKPTASPIKLAEAGVTDVFSKTDIWPDAPKETLENGLLHYNLTSPRRAFVWSGKEDEAVWATLVEDGFDRQRLSATGPGVLTVRDRLMPGWTAYVDGRETPWIDQSPWQSPDGRRVQLWRNVELPPGEHMVEFRYGPPGLRTGLTIFAPCLLATAGLAWAGRRRP